MLKKIVHSIYVVLLCSFTAAQAAIYVINEKEEMVGVVQQVTSQINETLEEVGRRFGLGYMEMKTANPNISSQRPLPPHTPITMPSQFILPPGPKEGLVVNLPEYRLYYYPPDENVVITFPVGIGKEGWSTPVGKTKIIAKITHPIWRPTAKMLKEAEKIGSPLPDIFPSGPDNPLGEYALRLGWSAVLIHGTNQLEGIGVRASAGCIRMLPEDIEYLFNNVKIGSNVHIINEPIKMAHKDSNLWMQVYPSLNDRENRDLMILLKQKITDHHLGIKNQEGVVRELNHPSGLIRHFSITAYP